MPFPGMAAFPQELLDDIVSHIHPDDREALKACSLVMPLRETSQRRLWETMTLHICVSDYHQSYHTPQAVSNLYPPQRIAILNDAAKTADEWPHLFRCVQKIVVVDSDSNSDWHSENLTIRAQRRATEMSLLRHFLERTESVVAASFSFATPEILELLLDFAARGSTLREVRLRWHGDIPVDALVQLSTCGIRRLFLEGCMLAQTAPSSAPSRSTGVARTLQALALTGAVSGVQRDDYQHLREMLVRSVVPPELAVISELQYHISMDRHNMLSAVYAGTLQRLHLNGRSMATVSFDPADWDTPGIAFPKVLPQLQYLNIIFEMRFVIGHWLYEAVSALLDSDACVPKLECIEFQVCVYSKPPHPVGMLVPGEAEELVPLWGPLPVGLTLNDKELCRELLPLLQYLDDKLPTGATFRWCTMQMESWDEAPDRLWSEYRGFEGWMREMMPKLEQDGRLEFSVERAVFE